MKTTDNYDPLYLYTTGAYNFYVYTAYYSVNTQVSVKMEFTWSDLSTSKTNVFNL